ncbi:MAG: redox-sensing transcriptional repressor Rex [Clostridia bacterium]|nr:redox-sensing transcriptional repressor Rex [Clostridia bacterium]
MGKVSKATFSRLPAYLNYLKSLPEGGGTYISATGIAAAMGLGEVQVRKDLASVSGSGKPKVGYVISTLIRELEDFLGYNDVNDAVIVGAGKLGKAILDYSGFGNYGLNIIAAFDADETVLGETPTGKRIYHIEAFDDFVKQKNIKMGIITVPERYAQTVCDRMIKNGVLAILNFAPVHLDVPAGILVQDENMATALAVLSGHLKAKLSGGADG